MLAGTIVGDQEESEAIIGQEEKSSKQHFIYFSEIDRVFAIQDSLIIIKKVYLTTLIRSL